MISVPLIIIWSSYLISLFILIFWLLVFLEHDIKEDSKRLKGKFPSVTVAIPVYNEGKRADSVIKTIKSAINLNYPKDKLEIIGINHGSSDNSGEILDKFKDQITVLHIGRTPEERKGAAVNAALNASTSDYFVCLDADSFIEPDALLKMLPYFDDDERIAAVLPLMKLDNPQTILQKIQWCEYCVNLFYKKIMSYLNCIHVAPGPFSIYRSDIVKQLGGWDPNNLTEDLEISLKLQKYDYKIIQTFNASVYTIAPKTIKELYNQRNRWYKGAVLNAVKYKNMILNTDYGDFGLIQMPRVILAGVLAILLTSVTAYNFMLKPLIKKIYSWSFVDFNILMTSSDFLNRFSLIDLNYTNIFFAIVIFTLSIFFLMQAHKHTKEPLTKYGYFAVPAYLLAYSLIATIVWLGVGFDLVRQRKQKW